jgi:flagellar protein FliT
MARWHRARLASSMADVQPKPEQEQQQEQQQQRQEPGPQHIIALYEAMADVTSQMLVAARSENWDVLVTLEATCAAHVATLQRDEPALGLSLGLDLALSSQQIQQKAALVAQMLADDAEIRQLVTARMVYLSNQSNSASTERKLSRAYGS